MEEYDRKDDALIAMLIEEIKSLRQELKDHIAHEDTKIKELVEILMTTKHVIWFIRWAAGITTAVALSWVFFKEHFTLGIK